MSHEGWAARQEQCGGREQRKFYCSRAAPSPSVRSPVLGWAGPGEEKNVDEEEEEDSDGRGHCGVKQTTFLVRPCRYQSKIGNSIVQDVHGGGLCDRAESISWSSCGDFGRFDLIHTASARPKRPTTTY